MTNQPMDAFQVIIDNLEAQQVAANQ